MIRVLFVCHGNICRSPMAEFLMRKIIADNNAEDLISVSSCATSTEELGNDIHYGTREILLKHKIPFQKRKAVRLKKSDYDKYDYIIGMDSYNILNINYIIKDDVDKKVYKLLDFTENPRDVDDPWYTGDFDTTYVDINNGCKKLFEYIKQNNLR